MIVKNEQNTLRECFESVESIADEIVLVDTGSTDNTLNIAAAYHAKIFHFRWINDFSAARNFALSKCSGSWILYLDADERLDRNSLKPLQEIISGCEKKGFRCEVISKNSNKNSSQVMFYTRLFYNTPGIKFTGKIHEQIDSSLLENGYQIVSSGISIDHIGYDLTDEELRIKAERNLTYLQREFECNPSSYYAYQIGNTYEILDDNEKAFEFFNKALEDSLLSNEYQAVCYLHLASYSLRKHKISEAAQYAKIGIDKNPEMPQLYLISSQIKFRSGEIKEALNYCAKSIKVIQDFRNKRIRSSYVLSSIDIRKPIYQGIYIAITANDYNCRNQFLRNLFEVCSKEADLIEKLIENRELSVTEIDYILTIFNDDNMQCMLALLEKYTYSEISLKIALALLKFIPGNSRILTFIGRHYLEANECHTSVEYFEKALAVKEKDASAAFFLISALIQINQFGRIAEILAQAEKDFGNIPRLKESFTALKLKLNPLLSTTIIN